MKTRFHDENDDNMMWNATLNYDENINIFICQFVLKCWRKGQALQPINLWYLWRIFVNKVKEMDKHIAKELILKIRNLSSHKTSYNLHLFINRMYTRSTDCCNRRTSFIHFDGKLIFQVYSELEMPQLQNHNAYFTHFSILNSLPYPT